MDRGDIPEVLFSCIREDDPYRASKLLQIERWCYVNWHLHQRGGKKRHNFIAQVLSDEECWEKVNNLHRVKLNRQMVGKKLILPPDSDNPFTDAKRYKIACECCLEEDVRALFEERKEELLAQGKSSLLEYEHLIGCFGEGALGRFWSHFVGGYASKLNLKGRHIYEYGLDCAIDCRQVQAVEFFWSKIKSLPENEMSAQKKDEIFMKNAVYSAGPNFRVYPDIFEFFLNQINPDRYPELLKRDLEKNGYYGSLNIMIDILNFGKFQELFDCLEPSDVRENNYYIWLKHMTKECPEHYLGAGVEVFMHMWKKEGFDNHRTFTLDEELMKDSSFQGRFSVYLVEKGFIKPVWAMLDKANSRQIKEFMDSKKDHIRSILLGKEDSNSLNRFLAYGKSANEELNPKNIPGPSGDLTEVEVRKTHSQSK
ncbi:hypothetical protein HGO53_01315 [Wolbachia endosymbiont of Diaphorina citri]|jgi:hypothetical protein|uniref:hypothetical protein n=1 Tax=Wolbachia endosymbiont of Diaphorina citri TaxID=116598 RepID=UPI00155F144B|nr:hypothetical protein [Wolbachia endosymbiont of Diaphorina citri]QJT95003.1 hypothetical protein HGO48_06855 [Wolbachia endosymbiont of Diaphorina citri]QJT96245.1 hypothetical protein HGO49_06920 [Wolbachia endosymbiont of Diaphorina citri]QJT96600.1 hypothetical protein HGO53_01315 [Wolbachia endosymbiont of Diaphorina citri]QLK11698.1 hypothetical protein FK497_05670 [Wolbachia endosymbiont of Diaphorina citri]QXY86679.1 hypothetical protein GZ064_01355 [Wolbachia endosymbiont of Diaphor